MVIYKYLYNILNFVSWPIKSKIFTVWLFKKKFANIGLKHFLHPFLYAIHLRSIYSMPYTVQGTWLRLKTWIMQGTFFKGVHNFIRKAGTWTQIARTQSWVKEESWERGDRLRTVIFQKRIVNTELGKLEDSHQRSWDWIWARKDG